MIRSVSKWLQRYLGDPDLLGLLLVLAIVVLVFIAFSNILLPIIASIVIAYLLQWGVQRLERIYVPHPLAVVIVYVLFLASVGIALFGLLPLLWRQLTSLVNELPNTLGRAQSIFMELPQRYPAYISSTQVQELIGEFKVDLARGGQMILSLSLASIPSIIAMIVYLVMVPMLVYFFLMDRQQIIQYLSHYLPKRRRMLRSIWKEVHAEIGNYVGGKLLEIAIVWATCFIVFWFMGLRYAILLSALVGLSAIVPYIGAVIATVPVVVIAFLEWGWSAHFAYLVVAYAVLITLDANVLVPLLFSGVVALHPIAIIIATLVFGRLWGFWGVFFAIPLALLAKAILHALQKEEAGA